MQVVPIKTGNLIAMLLISIKATRKGWDMKVKVLWQLICCFVGLTLITGCYTKFSSTRPSDVFLQGKNVQSEETDGISEEPLYEFSDQSQGIIINQYFGGYSRFFRPYYSLSYWHDAWYDPFYDPLWPHYPVYVKVWDPYYAHYGYIYYYPSYWHKQHWRYNNGKAKPGVKQHSRTWGRVRSATNSRVIRKSEGTSARTVDKAIKSKTSSKSVRRVTTGRSKTAVSKQSTKSSSNHAKKSKRTFSPKSQNKSDQVEPTKSSHRGFKESSSSKTKPQKSQRSSRPSSRSR